MAGDVRSHTAKTATVTVIKPGRYMVRHKANLQTEVLCPDRDFLNTMILC